jgi:hypothetical protein
MSFDATLVKSLDDRIEKRKKTAPVGPWTDEPNRVEFKHAGLDCLLSRTAMGYWCGYVGLPRGHRFYGKSYDEDSVDVRVHGGLTYAEECNGHVCHLTEDDDKLWWLGFDCAHYMDLSPLLHAGAHAVSVAALFGNHGHYWTLEEVQAETRRLAEQLAA